MPAYDKKIIKSGNVIEIFEYQEKIVYGYDNNCFKLGRSGQASDDDKILNRQKSVLRARHQIRQLVNSNFIKKYSKFVTLTFKENIKDLEKANYEFKKFILRLNYRLNFNASYLSVIEFQDKNRGGVIHYHTIFFNMPYLSNMELSRIWGNGFVKINRIDEVDNVGAYVCKYLQKSNDDDRLKGHKCYFTSRNLLQSQIIKLDKNKKTSLEESLLKITPKYTNTFTNEYNTVQYSQYILPDE